MADTYAIVSNTASNSYQVVDLTTQTSVAMVSASTPGAIAVLPDGSQAYITNNDNSIPGVLYNIALPSYVVGSTITLADADTEVVATPDGTYVFAAAFNRGTISPVATPSNVAGSGIVPGGGIAGIPGLAVDPASANLYATTSFNGIVPITIPAFTVGTPWGSAFLPSNPQGIVIMPDGVHGYVSGGNSGGIYPINVVTQTVGSVITTSSTTSAIFLQPGGSQIWAPDTLSNDVMVFDTATNLQVATVTLTGGTVSQSGGFDTAGDTFYACAPAAGNIYSIDTTAYTLGPTYTGLTAPRFMAVVPAPVVSEMIVMIV